MNLVFSILEILSGRMNAKSGEASVTGKQGGLSVKAIALFCILGAHCICLAQTTTPTKSPSTKSATNTVVMLPIVGDIGVTVRGQALRAALSNAMKHKPDFIVLMFDTPGGRVDEVKPLLDALREVQRPTRLVAYVRRAISAGAIVALACPE